MLKRDHPYDLFSREIQAPDELFSREPEDWAGLVAKRQPPPHLGGKHVVRPHMHTYQFVPAGTVMNPSSLSRVTNARS